ncbi:MAG: hypothetical protein GY755_22055 [Chloroflexi bacterium]|nr:hypothetical protein [Chloroflexota bacterium]
MDPYIHAVSSRGEGFQCDEIDNLDKYAAQQAEIEKAMENRPQKENKVKVFFSRFLKVFRKKD